MSASSVQMMEMNKNMNMDVRYDVSCFRFATCALRLFNRSGCTMVPRNSASSYNE